MDDIFDTSEVALMQNIEDKWLMCRIYFSFPGCISNVAILIWKRVLWVKRSFFFFLLQTGLCCRFKSELSWKEHHATCAW